MNGKAMEGRWFAFGSIGLFRQVVCLLAAAGALCLDTTHCFVTSYSACLAEEARTPETPTPELQGDVVVGDVALKNDGGVEVDGETLDAIPIVLPEHAARYDGRPHDLWRRFSEASSDESADTWRSSDGVLRCTGLPKGYLSTKGEYTNFVLRLQWRWPEGVEPGRGGILVRRSGEHKIWPKSLEAQINHPDAGDFWGLDGFALSGAKERLKQLDHEQFGALTNLAKSTGAERPAGQWNDYAVIARGDEVVLVLNGRLVNRATGCDVVGGSIAVTAEGNPIAFRNIRVYEIPERPVAE